MAREMHEDCGNMDLSELNRSIESISRISGVEATYNEVSGEIELFRFKRVVEDEAGPAVDRTSQITLSDAKRLDPGAMVGDELGLKLSHAELSQAGLITATVTRLDRGSVFVDAHGIPGVIDKREAISSEFYNVGDRIEACLTGITRAEARPCLQLSRSTPRLLERLLEREVPEIHQGVVEIKSIARDAGSRAKVAVTSRSQDIDPVGACIGLRGARVRAVSARLGGERIDVIRWSEDPADLVKAAIAPAQVSYVRIDPKRRAMELIAEDSTLSAVIGRHGQNIRLAVQLTGWRLAAIGMTDFRRRGGDEDTYAAA